MSTISLNGNSEKHKSLKISKMLLLSDTNGCKTTTLPTRFLTDLEAPRRPPIFSTTFHLRCKLISKISSVFVFSVKVLWIPVVQLFYGSITFLILFFIKILQPTNKFFESFSFFLSEKQNLYLIWLASKDCEENVLTQNFILFCEL